MFCMVLRIKDLKILVFAAQTDSLLKGVAGFLNTCHMKNVIQGAKIRIIKCIYYNSDSMCFIELIILQLAPKFHIYSVARTFILCSQKIHSRYCFLR